jgi:hypothetical protein
MRRTIGLIVAVALSAGCVAASGGTTGSGAAAESPPPQASVETTATPAAASLGPSPATLPATPPMDCPVTKPPAGFVPPPPAPGRPPAYYDSVWYGTPALWTMVHRTGEVWAGLPQDPAGFGQKTFWWSVQWDLFAEPEPAVSVSGRRLDGPERFATSGLGTNAEADFGVAMLIGVEVPTAGCWELTGTYREASLTYTVWVAG